MKRLLLALAPVLLLAPHVPAGAQKFDANSFLDLRVVQPSDQRSWMDGGLGKLRFDGGAHNSPDLHFAELVTDLRAQFDHGLGAFATLRVEPKQKTAIDILEAYARYQPISTGGMVWSIKLGAFFPPISLENEGVGWTSPWTLTPSALNTWVGEELRTMGAESKLEWRFSNGALTATAALFGFNDPAGVLLADRGWAMGDRPTGLIDHLRLPDASAISQRVPTPLYAYETAEIDNRPGWYGGLSWRQDGLGKLSLLRYDNRGDSTMHRNGQFAWHTQFTSAGLEADVGDLVLLSQAMIGDTVITPSPAFRSDTHFQAAYLLAGWDIGDWRAAGRVDFFATQESNPGRSFELSEHGHAYTLAATWRPLSWLRITGEALRIESFRVQRTTVGLPANAVEHQIQLGMRVFF